MADPAALARAILVADDRGAVPLLRRAGFHDPERANQALDRLSGPPVDLTPLPAGLLAAVLNSGWPDRALLHLERFVEVTGARASLYARLEQAPPVREGLLRLLAHSRFLTDVLVRNPEHLYWLFEATPHLSRPLGRAELQALQRQALDGVAEDGRTDVLRRFQRRELLRIGAGEILGCKDVVQVGRELADLADVTVASALSTVVSALRDRYGHPVNERGRPSLFTVIGLGKYGGRELNFSSDIDLLFAYDEDGHTRRPRAGRSVDNTVFFDRVAEGLIQALTAVTPEGSLYRVDMRLRPEGELGPLTRSLRSYWIYYETRGELWERQMLIKARHAAGSARLWRRFRHLLVPFVYPSHFPVPPQEEIRRVKERIEAEIRDQPGGSNNIKLQAGGIRDIEFVVQCLQLLRGRHTHRVRTAGTLESIARLQQSGALKAAESEALSRAYRFLRRLENLLQIESGRPVYAVPADGTAEAASLARLCQLPSTSLSSSVETHLRAVRTVYDAVFSRERGRPGPRRETGWLLEAQDGSQAAARHLRKVGFREGGGAHLVLRGLAGNPMMTSTGRSHLEALLPRLLRQLAATPDPDAGLVRFARIVDAYGAAGAFFGMAASHPRFLEMLVTICGTSGLLADLILHDPGLLDELVGLDPAGGVPRLEGRRPRDRTALRRFRDSALLHIGADDLLGLTSSEETFHRLSDLADEVVTAVVDDALGNLARRWGRPRARSRAGIDRGRVGFACFAGGKAGGRELDFASDLDLFFLYEGEGTTGRGKDNGEFFSQVARDVIGTLSGGLFAIDARLRPEGRNAPVVISLTGYRSYLRHRAATWERLALSRARQVAGDATFGRRVSKVIERFVYDPGLDPETIDEIADMRRRMEPGPERGRALPIDIKRGPGGIVDVEFIAQILVLHHGAKRRDLRHTNTRVVLERMVETDALGRREGRDLLGGYEWMRQLEKALRLTSMGSHQHLPTDEPQATVLARAFGADDAETLCEEVSERMARIRRLFDTVVSKVRVEAAHL